MRKLLCQISTHWDREWYRPFQGFRYYLVEMMDRLLDALESGGIPSFVFDGQTIPLDDYLEIRPENRARVESLVRSGQLKIGPWYVMPDELIVSGEALVENLLEGQNSARAYGAEPWKFGYICDMFGHAADMPRIFAGFGIRGAFLGRGATHLPSGTFFRWRAPDGSMCVVCKDVYADFKRAFDAAADQRQFLAERLDGQPIALWNYTDDHAGIDAQTLRFAQLVRELDCEVGGLEELPALAADMDLPTVTGELVETARTGADFRVVTGSISSYYPLKQMNDETEVLLWRETAPLLVMGEWSGILTDKRTFFSAARKYLLQNHPHDSMCGCSVDAVHADMPYRFRQVQAIGDVIREEFCTHLPKSEAFGFSVIHPDIHARHGVITVDVDFPRDWDCVYTDNVGYQKYNLFQIADEDNRPCAYQILGIQRGAQVYRRQSAISVDRYTLALDAALLPCGITPFRVTPADRRTGLPPESPEKASAENEFLRLDIGADGRLTLTDKETGQVFAGLHRFIDDGDAGNGWFREPAAFNEPRVLSSGAVRIEVLHAGCLVTTFRVTEQLSVPQALDSARMNRAAAHVPLEIVSEITLRRGERFVAFCTTVENRASSHRLRMVCPTGIAGTEYFASQGFGYVTRPRGAGADGFAGREPEWCEKNTAGIVGTGRFAFVGEGFHEGGVYPDGTVSMTMFRSVSRMFHQPEAVYARLLGTMTFRYALAVGAPREELLEIRENFAKPIVCAQTAAQSFLSVDSAAVRMSVLKPAESGRGAILRLYNPTDQPVDSGLKCIYQVRETDLDESADRPFCPVFRPYEIKTLRIEPNA